MLYQLCTIIRSIPTPPSVAFAIRYLSYSPLTAPNKAAITRKKIHLLCLKSIPSRRPLLLNIKKDMAASVTPAHCQPFKRSPNTSKAPTSTITGRVALIGPTIVSGRCFIAK